jgi:hypothetical protein
MTIFLALCNSIIDACTFTTEGNSLIKLRNVNLHPSNKSLNDEAARELERLILNKIIRFEEISRQNSYIIANVWTDSLCVNDHMQKLLSGKV